MAAFVNGLTGSFMSTLSQMERFGNSQKKIAERMWEYLSAAKPARGEHPARHGATSMFTQQQQQQQQLQQQQKQQQQQHCAGLLVLGKSARAEG
ncbi:unnamed protein product [Lampetra planeri]